MRLCTVNLMVFSNPSKEVGNDVNPNGIEEKCKLEDVKEEELQ